MMIPLRRALIVQEHGRLKYPEGTACAEVLKAGANAESRALASAAALRRRADGAARPERALSASTIFTGFGLGLVYKTLMSAFRLWKDVPEKVFGAPLKGGLDLRRDFSRTAGRRLHHRPAHLLDHDGRRRACPICC